MCTLIDLIGSVGGHLNGLEHTDQYWPRQLYLFLLMGALFLANEP